MSLAHSHAHAPGHSHAHSHPPHTLSGGTMGIAVTLTLTFVVAEAVCGWLGHSLALLSDAGHNLADAFALGLSWYALGIAGKPKPSAIASARLWGSEGHMFELQSHSELVC